MYPLLVLFLVLPFVHSRVVSISQERNPDHLAKSFALGARHALKLSSQPVTIEDRQEPVMTTTPEPLPVTTISLTTTIASETTLTAFTPSTSLLIPSITSDITSMTSPENTATVPSTTSSVDPASTPVTSSSASMIDNGALSKPMVIGIACIGAVALVALVIGVMFFVWYRKRRISQEAEMGYGGSIPHFVTVQPPYASHGHKEQPSTSSVAPMLNSLKSALPPAPKSAPPRPAPAPSSILGNLHYHRAAPLQPVPTDTRPDSFILPRESLLPPPPPAILPQQQPATAPALGFDYSKSPSRQMGFSDVPTHVVPGPPRKSSLAHLQATVPPPSPSRPAPWIARKVNYGAQHGKSPLRP